MKNKIFIYCMFILFSEINIFPEIIQNETLFTHYKTIDNQFINDNTFSLVKREKKFFYKFDSVELNLYSEGNYNYAVGAERYINAIYYFDVRLKDKIFGFDTDSISSYIKELGDITCTSSGHIYATDNSIGKIFFWDINNETYEPLSSINKRFGRIGDLAKDESDNVYILDSVSRKLYSFNDKTRKLNKFYNDKEYIDLTVDKDWGVPTDIEISDSGIYICYSGGAIVKYNLDGSFSKSYVIGIFNLELYASGDTNESDTQLISITTDSQGNIYVLDKKALKIHVFREDLTYLCSWEDPERPIEPNVVDISFMPGMSDFFLTYPWGFVMYQKKGAISSISVSIDTIGRGGRLDIIASNNDGSFNILNKYTLTSNEHYSGLINKTAI